MSSLLFQFFYGPEGKYEGYELLVEVEKKRNEGVWCGQPVGSPVASLVRVVEDHEWGKFV